MKDREGIMANVRAIGVDISKTIMHVQACNSTGKQLWRRKVRREHFCGMLANLPSGCVVYMEACQGAHYWSREAKRHGLRPMQIPAQYVKPFVKTNKNDFNDAEGTIEAGMRPSMKYVAMKSEGQLELQAMHRIRTRRISERTALINQIRGILAESGVVVQKSPYRLKNYLIEKFGMEDKVSVATKRLIENLQEEWDEIDQHISESEVAIRERARVTPVVKRLMAIPGIGILTATALVCACGNPEWATIFCMAWACPSSI